MCDDREKASKLIDKYLIPTDSEKKVNAEISTPYELRKDMLDKIPAEFWTKPRKVFEPCSGKGGFLFDIVSMFMIGLKEYCPNEEERYKIIVEECLYFSEFSETNIYINKLLLDPKNIYKLNYNIGNTLVLDIQKKWNLNGFDAVIGNPPYQLKVGERKTQPIWNLFFKMAINITKKNGYLVFVHPSGWRSPVGVFKDIFNMIKERKLIFLSMNDFKEGQRMFNSGTNFDYYVLKNINEECDTKIEDIDGKITKINLKKWDFIPSGEFDLLKKLISGTCERTEVLHDYSIYETRKIYMSKIKDKKHKYPCSYTITIKNGMNILYSDRNIGHFGKPKVIWSNGGGTYPIIDEKGEYGLTQFSYAIVDKPENLLNIKNAMNSKRFINLMTYVKFTENKYNYKVIRLLKKDFWKEFLT
jgi:hypothetical protein